MATPTIVTFSTITMTGPFTSTDNSNYFAISTPESGLAQVLERWRYIGQNGAALKWMGLGPRSGQILGWIDASAAANQKTAEEALTTLVTNKTVATITFLTGPEVTHGVFVGVSFPRRWGHGARFCTDFVVNWEKQG